MLEADLSRFRNAGKSCFSVGSGSGACFFGHGRVMRCLWGD